MRLIWSKNSDKCKYVYSGYAIAFDSVGSWSFGNDFSGDLIVFGVNNCSLTHIYSFKKLFSVR